MNKPITSIIENHAFDGIPINIKIDNKNVIITGGNGCGKTRLLEKIFSNLFERIASRTLPSLSDLKNELEQIDYNLPLSPEGSTNWSYYITRKRELESKINELQFFSVNFAEDGYEKLLASYHKNESVILYFPANRMINIERTNAIRPLNIIKENNNSVVTHRVQADDSSNTKSRNFEEYLVSLKQTSSMYLTEYNDQSGYKTISEWFDKLNKDLGILFEDESLFLSFTVEEGAFYINQEKKEPYRFQSLSSGFSSILSIYIELLMSVEVKNINPEDLTGLVIIDEIDAHLHISLQKKIFSFLTSSFPLIQFIVTTHSPFVVMSVDDAVIYDLSTKSQLEDLSSYSYESVATGLFGTIPTSKIITDKIKRISELAEYAKENFVELEVLIHDIEPHEEKLDEIGLLFFRKAKLALMKASGANDNV